MNPDTLPATSEKTHQVDVKLSEFIRPFFPANCRWFDPALTRKPWHNKFPRMSLKTGQRAPQLKDDSIGDAPL